MSLLQALTSRMAGTKTYVDDVFSAWVYTGTGASQTITNGIDLAGQGGMVWGKKRGGGTGDHHLYDTVRGATNMISSNTTGGTIVRSTGLTAFNSNGFSIGAYSEINGSGDTQVSWTFRKAPKFFDVQTATLASGNATVSFTDLATLGMVIVKRTDSTGSWYVWHRSLTAGKLLYLEQTAAEATLGHITVSGTTLTLVDGVLADGDYVCYGFAHDTSADGIIQCGSFTTDGSGNATVNLGWEPQYYLSKVINTPQNWYVFDSARGLNVSVSAQLMPNTSAAEYAGDTLRDNPTATGMKFVGGNPSETRVYLAIRRPNKPPTSGTQVYNAIAYTANSTDGRKLSGIGFPPDMVSIDPRSLYTTPGGPNWFSRLTGNGRFLTTAATTAELNGSSSSNGILGQDDFTVSRNGTNVWSNVSTYDYILHAFRRAPGVFDQVCYTGTGVAKTEAHNLGVVPELMIVKGRAGGGSGNNWAVYAASLGNTGFLSLNTTNADGGPLGSLWNSTTPTSSVFSLGDSGGVNQSSTTYTAYLWATKAGISKVGSYTGNGSNQTINCGFTTGARFILIKRTDFTGNWFVWDSVRGIVAGNDPHLSLNTTAAEVTTDDSIDPDTSGFIVNQDAATNINVNAATYIYLSLA